MPLKERYRLVRDYFKNDDKVAVYYTSDDELGIEQYNNLPCDQWNWKWWLDYVYENIGKLQPILLDGFET